jgi:hypothetical protein
MAAHGHCDALHVSIWDGEHALVIDPGTGGYFGSKELRAELASWNAHNGPQPVEGFKTPKRMGTFLVAEHHAPPEIICDGDTIRVSIKHEGVELLREVRMEGDELVIEDSIRPDGDLTSSWIFAPECDVAEVARDLGALSLSRDGKEWSLSLEGADVKLNAGRRQVSRYFGAVENAWSIQVTAKGKVRLSVHRGSSLHFQSSKHNEQKLAATF